MMGVRQDDRAIHNFRQYLRIKSVHPVPDYAGCVSFLTKLASEIGLKARVVDLGGSRPAIILTWEGLSPELPSILLNSHMDVVPVVEEEWSHEPFGADIDDNGNICARGSQDMKCTTIAEMEAIRRLIDSGVRLNRTVHLSVIPDEEIVAVYGMNKFVETEAFKELNVGFDLDEGCCSPDDRAVINKNDRIRWVVNIHCPGATSQELFLHNDTSGDKVRHVLDYFMDFRKMEYDKLSQSGDNVTALGDVTTINLTTFERVSSDNGEPMEFVLGFDMRIGAEEDHAYIYSWLQDVSKKAGDDVRVKFVSKDKQVFRTCQDDSPFLIALESVLKELGHSVVKANFYGSTDGKWVRQKGIPVLGFMPFFNTKPLLHGTDEYMNSGTFLQAISHYEKIITALANC